MLKFYNNYIQNVNINNKHSAIFLDRDGTINYNMDINISYDNFKLFDGVIEAIKKINKSKFLAIVITNQSVIAKGILSFYELNEIHKKMETLLNNGGAYLDGIYFCPHYPNKNFCGGIQSLKISCNCRKPNIGMLLQAAKDFNINLKSSWMIGDSDVDILAGKNAGCKTIKLNKDAPNLLRAVNLILQD